MTTSLAPRDGYSLANAHRFGWASLGRPLPQDRVALLREHLVGPQVLDAGCGGGGYVDFLARQGYDATGVDKFDMFLDHARSGHLRGKFLQADLTDRLPFADGEFDTTICFDVLEHVDDVPAFRELMRVTRRRIIFTVPVADERAEKHMLTLCPYSDLTHLRYYTRDDVSRLVSEAGPTAVRILNTGRVPLEQLCATELRAVSRYPLLTWFYTRLFRFLARRAVGPDWYCDWAAVVDLPPAGSAVHD